MGDAYAPQGFAADLISTRCKLSSHQGVHCPHPPRELLCTDCAAPKLLGLFSTAAAVCTIVAIVTTGMAPVGAVVLLGFFDSIMFPTIFALSIKNLGAYTKLGSSLLVMSIIGGAIVPAIMGFISDHSSIQAAFAVPLFCYGVVIYFSFVGYQPSVAIAEN